MTPPDLPDNALLAERLGITALELTVVTSDRVTPSMQRVVLTAPGLADLGSDPGQDLMLSIPFASGGVIRRRYSIRALDPEARTVTLDIVLHGDGPGAAWAANASAGDRVAAVGPRGKVALAPGAAWHLFVGDDSFAPAALAMAEAAPAPVPLLLVLAVDGDDDEPPHTLPADTATVVWVHRDGAPAQDPTPILDALAHVELPDGAGAAYVGAELGVMRAVNAALETRGIPADRVAAKPYWRFGQANAPHGEPDKS